MNKITKTIAIFLHGIFGVSICMITMADIGIIDINKETGFLNGIQTGVNIVVSALYLAILAMIPGYILKNVRHKKIQFSEEQKQLAAYHEAGHVLACKLLEIDVKEVSIVIKNGSIARTIYNKGMFTDYNSSKTDFINRLVILLAGREAERVIFKENSTACINDLEEATDIAKKMVTLYGMTDNLISFINLESEDEFGSEISNKIGLEIETLLKEAESKAKEIIKTNEDLLKRIAQTLIENEKISGEELKKIMKF